MTVLTPEHKLLCDIAAMTAHLDKYSRTEQRTLLNRVIHHLREIVKSQAAALPLEEMTDWQPIETAPIDPRRDPPTVMLWVGNGGEGGKGTHAFGRCYRSHDGRVRGVACGFSGDWSIKHWMPLPAPPLSSKERQP